MFLFDQELPSCYFSTQDHDPSKDQKDGGAEKTMMTDRRTLTAYHEAGHAVVAFDQGVRIFGISLVPGEGKMGHARVDTLFLDRRTATFPSDKGARNRFTLERHVMVLLGGGLAAEHLDPETGRKGETSHVKGSDHDKAFSLLLQFTGSRAEAEKYYEWLKVRAEGIVLNPRRWFQIKGLAEVLLEQEKLGTRKVMETLKDLEARWCEEHGGRDNE